MARLEYRLNNMVDAREHQIKGLELTHWGSPTVAAEIHHLAFFWRLAKGDRAQAEVCQDECKLLTQSEFFEDRRMEAAREVERKLALWRLESGPPELLTGAKEWSKARSLDPEDPIPFPHEYQYCIFAQLLFADGQPNEALKVADQLVRLARAAGRHGDHLGYLLIKVSAFVALDRLDDALGALQTAVILAESSRNIRIFIDGGPEIFKVLAMMESAGTNKRGDRESTDKYVRILVNAFHEESQQRPVIVDQAGSDRLSRRELQVLRLLSTHLTGPEIAQELFISINTYKSHTKNIYSKLMVGSRAEAVSRARELGLL